MRLTKLGCAFLAVALVAPTAPAAELLISLGIRETGTGVDDGPIGENGGAPADDIEWVNLDGQTLTADGTWQLFSFTPASDELTGFAGLTANGALDTDWGTLEHIRIRNTADGFTRYNVWIDDITNTDSSGAVNFGDFEGFDVGDEVIFQEPTFSGSTAGHLLAEPSIALVTDTMANTGEQSNGVEFEFVDDDPSRWIRLTTFDTPNIPNPWLHLRETGKTAQPTVTFWAKAEGIPEPASVVLAGLALLGLVAARRR